jgi:solute carrier family 25 carnitine/acylcarnitine transporter 20/29
MNEYIAGAYSGIGQTIIGHPFDTYKVCIQNNKSIFNINPMYGITYPMISSVISNSIIFGTNEVLHKYNMDSVISGTISGAISAPVVYLFDVFKLNRQIYQTKINWKSTTLPKHGKTTTFAREVLAFGSYFKTYELMKEKSYSTLISGGMAGLACWTITYPIDVIRNREMALNISAYKSYKMGNLTKGYSICAVRAILVNSVGFYIYEHSRTMLGRSDFATDNN